MYATQAKVRKIDGTVKPLLTQPRPGVVAVDAGHSGRGVGRAVLDAAASADVVVMAAAVADYKNGNSAALIADVQKLVADLGIKLS